MAKKTIKVNKVESKVYKYLPGTEEYRKNKKKFLDKAGLLKKYKKSNIMVVSYGRKKKTGISEIDDKNYVGNAEGDMLNEIFNIDRVSFKKRSKVEFNPKFVHIIGACLIESPNYILVQKAKTGRQEGLYTLVQGHVDYSKKYCKFVDIIREPKKDSTNIVKFIRHNTVKEISGEVAINGGTKKDISRNVKQEVSFLVNKNQTLTDREHILLVWECKLTDDMILKAVTKQDHKHDVVIISKKEIFDEKNVELYDDWLKDVLNIKY